ncbi:MAG: S8 family serine peptidase [candidate division Zixibacteria bacterium]|nr:S8 family serine peptidase [candidate division Zixibacteria bacterium]
MRYHTHKSTILYVLFLIVALLSPAVQASQWYADGELVVELVPGAAIEPINLELGTTVKRHLPLLDLYLLNAPEGASLDSLYEQLIARPDVEVCHRNWLVDPMRGVQSSLPFSDEQAYSGERYLDQPAVDMLDLDEVQSVSTGASQYVGIVDGGVTLDHPALEGKVISRWDYVDNDAVAEDEPGGFNSGHGTFVAGVIHLLAPDANIRAYRVCDTTGEADGFIVAEAILQAVVDGCSVINVSLSTYETHTAIAEVCAYARSRDVLVVCAAGNEYVNGGHYPGSDPNVLSVASVDTSLTLADYSSYGDHIALTAPGTDVYAPFQDTLYAFWSGTSFAAPFVTAEATLLLAIDPDMSWDELVDLLKTTAVSLDPMNTEYAGLIGSGVVNPYGAIKHLNGTCGDIDGDGSPSTVTDMVRLIDGLYFNHPLPDPVGAGSLDSYAGLTNNDLVTMVMSMYGGPSASYCGTVFGADFPTGTDTIIAQRLRIPPGNESWTVPVSMVLEPAATGFAVTLEYGCLTHDIELEDVFLQMNTSLGIYVMIDNTQNKLVLGGTEMATDAMIRGEHQLAVLTFSLAPSPDSHDIEIALTTYETDNAIHKSVISRYNPAISHVQGHTPSLVTYYENTNVDAFGHPCFGPLRGNLDGSLDDVVDISDLTRMIEYLYISAPAIVYGEADIAPTEGPNGQVDITDLSEMIRHLFIDFHPLPSCDDYSMGD